MAPRWMLHISDCFQLVKVVGHWFGIAAFLTMLLGLKEWSRYGDNPAGSNIDLLREPQPASAPRDDGGSARVFFLQLRPLLGGVR